MIEIISLHIPKTGGQSFYQVLKQVYGDRLSISYRREDYEAAVEQYGRFENSLDGQISVLHGHLYYKEVKKLHRRSNAKAICWLRDPVERVVSNYHYFKRCLEEPGMEPEIARLNAHRKNETLLEYAGRRDTRNRMSKFLKGLPLQDFYFIGLMKDYEEDLTRLGRLLGWGEVELPHLNQNPARQAVEELDDNTLKKLRRWNRRDIKLYEKAQNLR